MQKTQETGKSIRKWKILADRNLDRFSLFSIYWSFSIPFLLLTFVISDFSVNSALISLLFFCVLGLSCFLFFFGLFRLANRLTLPNLIVKHSCLLSLLTFSIHLFFSLISVFLFFQFLLTSGALIFLIFSNCSLQFLNEYFQSVESSQSCQSSYSSRQIYYAFSVLVFFSQFSPSKSDFQYFSCLSLVCLITFPLFRQSSVLFFSFVVFFCLFRFISIFLYFSLLFFLSQFVLIFSYPNCFVIRFLVISIVLVFSLYLVSFSLIPAFISLR